MSRTFVCVNDEVLVSAIERTKKRLVFIAPGLRPPVANALICAMRIVPITGIHLVLDIDAEVARLGYGDKDFNGMEILQKGAAQHGLTVNHHPGIRIGLLIADDTTLIYSPTALSIETENRQLEKPNAILLDNELPLSLANACAVGDKGYSTLEVGMDAIDSRNVNAVKRELEERPPKDFNVARIERVFSSILLYVEFKIENYRLTTRSLRLDPKLFGVRDDLVAKRLSSRYHLFAESDSLIVDIPGEGVDSASADKRPTKKFGPKSIDDERSRIKRRYVIEAGKNRSLILRRNVVEFEKEINSLRNKIKLYRSAIESKIGDRMKEIARELFEALAESLMSKPPAHWKTRHVKPKLNESEAKRLFDQDIESQLICSRMEFNPTIRIEYKGVTYETFHDHDFRKMIEDRFGKDAIADIYEEHDAAPEGSKDAAIER